MKKVIFTLFNILIITSAGTAAIIDWGDGTSDNVTRTGKQTHTYTNAGQYKISVIGARIKKNSSATHGQYKQGKIIVSCPFDFSDSDSNATSKTQCFKACSDNNSHITNGKMYYSDDGSGVCIPSSCEAGWSVQNGECQPDTSTCPAGKYHKSGTDGCVVCPDNYTSDAGATSINECYIEVGPGEYMDTETDRPTKCPAGSYCNGAQGSEHKLSYGEFAPMTLCPLGYTSDAGATSINECYINVDPGKYLNSQGTQIDCETDYYCTGGKVFYGSDAPMTKCENGYFTSVQVKGTTYMSLIDGDTNGKGQGAQSSEQCIKACAFDCPDITEPGMQEGVYSCTRGSAFNGYIVQGDSTETCRAFSGYSASTACWCHSDIRCSANYYKVKKSNNEDFYTCRQCASGTITPNGNSLNACLTNSQANNPDVIDVMDSLNP